MPRARRPRTVPLASHDDARAAAGRVLALQLAAFARELRGARAGDVEAIHRLRVAARRLRATLELFAPLLPQITVATATEDLAWLGRAVGGVRDLDVLALAVAARSGSLPDEVRAALGPLHHAIAERRAVALAEMGRVLDMPRSRRVVVRLGQLAAPRAQSRATRRLGDVAGDLLRPLIAAVRRAGRECDPDTPPVSLHRLRVRAKRLRYACETLEALAPGVIRPLIARLVALQEVLGEHQDAVTQAHWLRAHADAAQLRPATLLAMGALVDRLERRAAKLRVRAAARWRQVDRRRLRVGVLAALRRARHRAPDRSARRGV